MSVVPPPTWQPPMLARPSHGLLARRGWVWLAVPGVVLLVVSTVLAGVLGSSSPTDNRTATGLLGLVSLLGAALLVIGLPVRALVVRRHRRRAAWSPALLPALGGRYAVPSADGTTQPGRTRTDVAPDHATQHAGKHLVVGTLLTVWLIGGAGLMTFVGAQGAYEGLRTVRLQHSSTAAHLTATLDRDTAVHHGRSTTYYDRVSYSVDGTTEDDVTISAAGARHAGDPIAVIVDPGAPTTAIAASDHGWGDLILGGIVIVLLPMIVIAFIVSARRKARHPAPHGTGRQPPRPTFTDRRA